MGIFGERLGVTYLELGHIDGLGLIRLYGWVVNLVLEIFSLFTADLQISNCDRVTGVALSLLLICTVPT